jgi:hypothetical protein
MASIAARLALLLGVLLPSLGGAEIVADEITGRAAFDSRLGTVQVINFDDVTTTSNGDPTPFAVDRYANQGIVITGETGQYASQAFGFAAIYPTSSAPNHYAPGPIDDLGGGGNMTNVTFLAGGQPALVAGFGAIFVDPDFPSVSSITAYDAQGSELTSFIVPDANESTIFRGVITADDMTGLPTPAIARVLIVNGTGWPAATLNDGVPLDDFVFGTPAPDTSTTTTSTTVPGQTTTTTTPGPLVCSMGPREGCRRPVLSGAAKLRVRDAAFNDKDKLRWAWAKGSATSREEFGDPTADTSFAVCAYDPLGRILSARLPGGGTCGGQLCWKATRTGFRYKDLVGTREGIVSLRLRAGPDESAKIVLIGRGSRLGLPGILPLATPVTVQLVREGGTCWEARFSVPKKSSEQQFKATAD